MENNKSMKSVFTDIAKQKKPRNIYYNVSPNIAKKGEEKLFAVPEPWPGIIVRTKESADK